MPVRDRAAPLTERRVLIYGVTGSGKTTAAARVAALTRLPLHRVDELTWLPGWVPVETYLQREMVADITATDAWVLDTAYGAWLDLVLPRCQLVVGLDYPRWLSLGRLVRRTISRLIDRRPMLNGNVETVRNVLSSESIIIWHFKSFARKRARMRDWAASYDGLPVLLFRHPAQLERWLSTFDPVAGADPTSPNSST